MSDDWTASRLGDHLREPIRNGYSPGAPDRPTGKWQLTLAALTPLGFDPSGVKHAPADDLRLNQSLLSPGDILVSRSNTPDRVGLAGIYSGEPTNCSYPDLMMKVRLRESLDAAYCVHLLLSSAGRRYFSENARGSSGSMVKIDRSILQAFPLKLPSRSEQKAVTRVLADADSLLASLDSLLAKKRELKQATMQRLLTGSLRLPGFGGKPWEQRHLGSLGEWKGGMTPPMQRAEYWSDQGIPWISSGDVKSPRLTRAGMSVTQLAVRDGATTLVPPCSVIVVTRSGILRKRLPVAINVVPMAINQDVKALIPSTGISASFVLNALTAAGDQILAQCVKSGTTVESVDFRWLKAFTIGVPSLEEQIAISEVFFEMDLELQALEDRRNKARELKQGMMQQLLTGRIRLI